MLSDAHFLLASPTVPCDGAGVDACGLRGRHLRRRRKHPIVLICNCCMFFKYLLIVHYFYVACFVAERKLERTKQPLARTIHPKPTSLPLLLTTTDKSRPSTSNQDDTLQENSAASAPCARRCGPRCGNSNRARRRQHKQVEQQAPQLDSRRAAAQTALASSLDGPRCAPQAIVDARQEEAIGRAQGYHGC